MQTEPAVLTAQAVLQAWDQARGRHPLRQPLELLCAAWPELDADAWSALPLGVRDAHLLALHESLFGTELDTVVDCPRCHVTLQTQISTAQLRVAGSAASAGSGVLSLQVDDFELVFRLPSSDDLLAIDEAPDASPDSEPARLIERCVLSARRSGTEIEPADLPVMVLDRLQQEMARRDPGADTTVTLTCPACAHEFERGFDIGAYLWSELSDWAGRTLDEVHTLASVYGWSEAQILGLSAARRGDYIARVQG